VADILLVRWPEDRAQLARLRATGAPILHLVEGDVDPPTPLGCLEDWARLPGDERDLAARLTALELRAAEHQAPPTVDDEGRLHHRGKVLLLATEEVELVRALTDHFGQVVVDAELGDAGALRGRMARLRPRLRDVDLSLRRARRRGYVLQGR
jgi:hypothetical protein